MPLLQIYNTVFFIDYYTKWESEAGNRIQWLKDKGQKDQHNLKQYQYIEN